MFPPLVKLPIPFMFAKSLRKGTKVVIISLTANGCTPEPLEMRRSRVCPCLGSVKILSSLSSSEIAIESIMVMNLLILCLLIASWSLPMPAVPRPGIMDISLPMDPMDSKFWNCSYMSLNVKPAPFCSFFSRSLCVCSNFFSSNIASKPEMSPLPNRRETKDCVLKGSKSSMCSPVPTKTIGELVAATALSAPPPLACPSSLVIMTEPMSTASLKAVACSLAACPIELSITKTVVSGLVARETSCISSNRAASCLCLPEVSTIMTSYFASLNLLTPSSATNTGSFSV
mmetsp:Transcript_24315/g.34330  ORF Transcript_24315/g.34330 Transcript_24315/m.34330 type:complete len:287 (-) Transcript_24315:499-1359(-)